MPRAGDQLPQAGRVTAAQVGYGVQPANFTLEAARWLVNDLLENAVLRQRARHWQQQLNALGGVETARRCLQG